MTLTISKLNSAKSMNDLNPSQSRQICGGFINISTIEIKQYIYEQNSLVDGEKSIGIMNYNGNGKLNVPDDYLITYGDEPST